MKKTHSKIKSKRQKSLFWFKTFVFGMLFTAVVSLVLSGLGYGMSLLTYAVYANKINDSQEILNANKRGIILEDRHGTPFFTFYNAKDADPVNLDDVSPYVIQAVIAAEDKKFYNHHGFDPQAIVAAAFANLKAGKILYGGSTVTQQLVKMAFLSPKKSFIRKYQEVVLAKELERRYSKEEIMEMYLNVAYFGEGAFGIEQAAQTYFGIPAQKLSVAQASILAGLLKAPSELSPVSGDKEAALERQKFVLQEMKQAGFITEAQYNEASSEKLSFEKQSPSGITFRAPHFALMVRDQLLDQYGEEFLAQSGFHVRTTLDLNWQDKAEQAVRTQVSNLSRSNVTNGAAVAIDVKTGEVKALVGSVDWDNDRYGKVNMAISPRQPGSSFKPIVYLTAISQKKITPATILNDKPTTFAKTYKPENYDNRYRGPVSARFALANSLNVPAVSVITQTGVPSVLSMAKRLGITSLKGPSNYGPSLALGAGEVSLLEMTNAYATLANNGYYHPPLLMTSIVDKTGEVVETFEPEEDRVVSSRYAYLVTSMLSDNKARQTVFGNSLTVSKPAAVKTGTTQSYRDSWTIGYTPTVTVGVWVGNNNNAPMTRVAGSLGAAPIWKNLIESYSDSVAQDFSIPTGLAMRKVCTPQNRYPSPEYFIAGTEPSRDCVYIPPTPTPEGGSPEMTADASQNPEKPAEPQPHKDKKDKKDD